MIKQMHFWQPQNKRVVSAKSEGKKKRPNFKHSLSNYLLDMSYRLWKVPKGIVFFLYLGKICLTCHTDKGTLDQAEFIVTVSFVSILKAKY